MAKKPTRDDDTPNRLRRCPMALAGIEEFGDCSLCGKRYANFGNSARPFEGRCCDDCEENVVVPARLKALRDYEPPKPH